MYNTAKYIFFPTFELKPMTNEAKQMEIFREFAEKRLEVHKRELETRYHDRKLASIALIEEAYIEHQRIFEKELSEKIGEISKEQDLLLRPSFQRVKDKFVDLLEPAI